MPTRADRRLLAAVHRLVARGARSAYAGLRHPRAASVAQPVHAAHRRAAGPVGVKIRVAALRADGVRGFTLQVRSCLCRYDLLISLESDV